MRPLRQAVLRPHQALAELEHPHDDARDVLQAAAWLGGRLVGTATVVPVPDPADPRPGDWRLRAMAVAPGLRGRGIGAALLRSCLEHVVAHGGARVWCTARVAAVPFYERHGFARAGAEHDEPVVGRHVPMRRAACGLHG